MAYDLNGTTQYLSVSSAPVTAVPLTLACWFNTDSNTTDQYLMAVSNAASSRTGWMLMAAGSTTVDRVRARTSNAASDANAVTTSSFTAGVWCHACGVFSADNSRTAYINGGSSANNTTSMTPSAVSAVNVGVLIASSLVSLPLNGRIAEPAIWNAALTDAEVASLARGVSPVKIRPQNLVFYPDLVRDLTELRQGLTLTAVGSPSVAAHPRIYGL